MQLLYHTTLDRGDGEDERAGADDGGEGEAGGDAVREGVPGLLGGGLPGLGRAVCREAMPKTVMRTAWPHLLRVPAAAQAKSGS